MRSNLAAFLLYHLHFLTVYQFARCLKGVFAPGIEALIISAPEHLQQRWHGLAGAPKG
jgi:hypothetical protein